MQVTLQSDVVRDGQEESVGGNQEVVSTYGLAESTSDESIPDAACRGWVDPPDQQRIEALFVLAGLGLGIQRTDLVTTPVWLDLSEVEALDAIGDPQDGLTQVEIVMTDLTVVGAGWTEAFCNAVVLALSGVSAVDNVVEDVVLTDQDSSITQIDTAPGLSQPVLQVAAPVVRDRSRMAEAAEVAEAAEAVVLANAAVHNATPEYAAVLPEPSRVNQLEESVSQSASNSPGLELEDVVYISGYPGQTKKRKNCTAVLTRSGIEVAGPGDLRFRMSWESVSSIEPQNSDEARFRMNTKIHRDSSALVLECDQGIIILLEARDCSTIPLRSAITQLLIDLPVQVV